MNEENQRAQGEPMDDSKLRAELEKHHLASFGWALSCCGRDPLEAEDVLQTVYLKVLDGRARYDGRAAFKTWLFAVIRKTAADSRRKNLLRRLWLLDYERKAEPAARAERADENVERSERQARFQAALAELPARQRQVLQLVFYHDLTVQQAAEVMEISVGSARTHYERGKQRLREWWEQSRVFEEHGIGRSQTETALS